MISTGLQSWADAHDAIVQELMAAADAGDVDRSDVLLDLLREIADLDQGGAITAGADVFAEDERVQDMIGRLTAALSDSRRLQLGLAQQ